MASENLTPESRYAFARKKCPSAKAGLLCRDCSRARDLPFAIADLLVEARQVERGLVALRVELQFFEVITLGLSNISPAVLRAARD